MHNARSTVANVRPEQTARRRKPDMAGKALTLRVTLTGTDPEVWRLVQVPAEMTLADLSDALEDAMGWEGDHLHTFGARGVTYWTPPHYGDDIDSYEDDTQHQVGELLWRRRMKLRWVYDLGACWHHEIVVASDPAARPKVLKNLANEHRGVSLSCCQVFLGGLGQGLGLGCLVGGLGFEHGEDDVAAASGDADDGGVVAFAL